MLVREKDASTTYVVAEFNKPECPNRMAQFFFSKRPRTKNEIRKTCRYRSCRHESLGARLLLAGDTNSAVGDQALVYRIAIATTAEFTQLVGGVDAALASAEQLVDDLNEIFLPELGIRLDLVSGTSTIFTDPAADGLTNESLPDLIREGTQVLDTALSSSSSKDALPEEVKYDFGHVLGFSEPVISASGQAFLGIIGDYDDFFLNDTGLRGGGGTLVGGREFVNGPLWTTVVAHEIGHQFGARHTFSSRLAGTACDDFGADQSAYEVGSGSTIMSYAGICAAHDLSRNRDLQFHAASFEEIHTLINANRPRANTLPNRSEPLGNSIPIIDATPNDGVFPTSQTSSSVTTTASQPHYFIPAGTPFVLDAAPSDPDEQDSWTVSWEQLDAAPGQGLPVNGAADGPLFRSFPPTPQSSRSFPQLESLIDGVDTAALGESLSTKTRDLNFRATIRDGRGGVNSDDIKLGVVDTGQSFSVDQIGDLVGGSEHVVTWNVAGTDGNGIDVSHVAIELSTDEGETFSYQLELATENDGTATVRIPNIDAPRAWIRVRAVDNVFYALSPVSFAIQFDAESAGLDINSGNQQLIAEGVGRDLYQLTWNQELDSSTSVDVLIDAGQQALVSIDGVSFNSSQTVRFSAGADSIVVHVQALDDDLEEGRHGVLIHHRLASTPVAPLRANENLGSVDFVIIDDELPPLVGVDWGQTGSTNRQDSFLFANFIADGTATNLESDAGVVTEIDVQTPFVASSSSAYSGPVVDVHRHLPALNHLDGLNFFTGDQLWTTTFSDLIPGGEYQAYVFGIDSEPGDYNNHVTIRGESNVAFEQRLSRTANGELLSDDVLFVNQSRGDGDAKLSDSAVSVFADSSGVLQFEFRRLGESLGASVAAIAISPPVESFIEKPALTVQLADESINESSTESTLLTVSRSGDLDEPVEVFLSSDFSNKISLPFRVTIPAQQASASLSIAAVDDIFRDDDVVVQITAAGLDLESVSSSLTIVNDDLSLHYVASPFDVNVSGEVTALDALTVINLLGKYGEGSIDRLPKTIRAFPDTSNDDSVSARDALLVINALNQPESESERLPVDFLEKLSQQSVLSSQLDNHEDESWLF